MAMDSDTKRFLSYRIERALAGDYTGMDADTLYVETGADEEEDTPREWFDEQVAKFVAEGWLVKDDEGLYQLQDPDRDDDE